MSPVEVICPREYSQKKECVHIALHFISCSFFELLTLLRYPYRPHPISILSTTREHERDRPTTSALPTLWLDRRNGSLTLTSKEIPIDNDR
jgi:hypothetical protein